ncbi:MAG: metallophosphoesterase [Oscillospiraceae bacterium]|nr:metallophosphoesterase [Oscillospiraceae bacterium]
MAVFVIADLHLALSDKNKSMEVFGGRWNDYINKLERNWNTTVKDSDSVIIAGDISWGMNIDSCGEDFRFINSSLNGTKYILKGNHDYWWTTASKINKWLDSNGFYKIKILHNNAYLCENYIICGSRGWFIDDEESLEQEPTDMFNQKILNREIGRLELSIQAAKKIKLGHQNCELVSFLHYPPIYGGYICPRIIEVLARGEIEKCYFGHIHNASEIKIKRIYENIRFELISADYLKFMPLKIR